MKMLMGCNPHRIMAFAVLAAVASAFAFPHKASATLIFDTSIEISGTGLGAVNTLVTAHDPPGDLIESGCVGRSGGADLVGPTACLGGLPGGDELAINQTVRFGDIAGLTDAGDLALVFNIAETGQDLMVQLDQLYLSIFNQADGLIFDAFLDAGDVGNQHTQGTGTGTGGSGFVYLLSPPEQLTASALGFNADWRVGGGFTATDTIDGNETLHVISLEGPVVVPEPSSLLLLGSGLAGLFGWRYRHKA